MILVDTQFKEEDDMFKFLSSYLVAKYASVFKNNLEEGDVIKTKKPIVIELDADKGITPTNIQTSAEIPLHLRTAEVGRCLSI